MRNIRTSIRTIYQNIYQNYQNITILEDRKRNTIFQVINVRRKGSVLRAIIKDVAPNHVDFASFLPQFMFCHFEVMYAFT